MVARDRQAGFSLVELLVAMVVTLLVSGAVFGLMTSGQGAFRREPELVERQQNIRAAMAIIERDLLSAGTSMGPFTQVFTAGLDGGGPVASVAKKPDGSAYGGNADVLEFWGSSGECPAVTSSKITAPPTTTSAGLHEVVPGCFFPPAARAFYVTGTCPNGESAATEGSVHWGQLAASPAAGFVAQLDFGGFPAGVAANSASAPCSCTSGNTCISVIPVERFRYEIVTDAQGVPSLWRSTTGDEGNDTSDTAVWSLVATGIEDLQVRYQDAVPNALADAPPAVVSGNYDTLVRSVEVTLSARALAPGLQGATVSAQGDAVRGQLTTTITPRAALVNLKGANPPKWK